MKFTLSREQYVPSQYHAGMEIESEKIGGSSYEVYKYEKEVGGTKWFVGVMFGGRSNKPKWSYRFATEEQRAAKVAAFVEGIKSHEERKAKNKAERVAFKSGYKVGDILVCSWGYGQTNKSFYQVTEVVGPKTIKLAEIGAKTVEHETSMSGYVMPVPGAFISEERGGGEMTKRVSPGYKGGKGGVKVYEFASAYEWDGKKEFTSSWY